MRSEQSLSAALTGVLPYSSSHMPIQEKPVTDYWRAEAKMCSLYIQKHRLTYAIRTEFERGPDRCTAVQLLACAHTRKTSDWLLEGRSEDVFAIYMYKRIDWLMQCSKAVLVSLYPLLHWCRLFRLRPADARLLSMDLWRLLSNSYSISTLGQLQYV